jgi:hypothetical protein
MVSKANQTSKVIWGGFYIGSDVRIDEDFHNLTAVPESDILLVHGDRSVCIGRQTRI